MCPANSPLAATLGQSILWRGVKEVKPLASLKLYLCMVGKFEARWWASILLMGRLRVPALCCSSQGRSWYSHLAMASGAPHCRVHSYSRHAVF